MWGEDGELGRVYAGCRALYTLVMRGQELVHFTKVLVAGEELLLKVACSAMSEVGKGNYLTQQALHALLPYARIHLPDVKRLRLQVGMDNEAAMHVYQQLGFEELPRDELLEEPEEGHECWGVAVAELQRRLSAAAPPNSRFACAVYAGF